MYSYKNIIKLPFDIKSLKYERFPDENFDYTKQSLLGEMYNKKMDKDKQELSHLNVKGWQNFAWCFYKLTPGRWVPPHKDHFKNYCNYYKISDKNKIMRTIIFLEDSKPGHVFGINDDVILKWNAYDSITWNVEEIHWGGNFGSEQRYTLQLTGTEE